MFFIVVVFILLELVWRSCSFLVLFNYHVLYCFCLYDDFVSPADNSAEYYNTTTTTTTNNNSINDVNNNNQ